MSEGRYPRSLCNGRARDWPTFGDALLEDLRSEHELDIDDKDVCQAIASRGGLIQLFRELFPQTCGSLDRRWGLPSQHVAGEISDMPSGSFGPGSV